MLMRTDPFRELDRLTQQVFGSPGTLARPAVMPQIVAATASPTRASQEEFLALLCADEQLLRAEFDAIIAAAWPNPPPTRPRPERPGAQQPPSAASAPASRPAQPGRAHRPGVGGLGRQRAPPLRSAPSARAER